MSECYMFVSPGEHDLAIGRQERDFMALGEFAGSGVFMYATTWDRTGEVSSGNPASAAAAAAQPAGPRCCRNR